MNEEKLLEKRLTAFREAPRGRQVDLRRTNIKVRFAKEKTENTPNTALATPSAGHN